MNKNSGTSKPKKPKPFAVAKRRGDCTDVHLANGVVLRGDVDYRKVAASSVANWLSLAAEWWHERTCKTCPHKKLSKKYGLIDKLFGRRTKQTEEERRVKAEQYFHGLQETQDRLLDSLNDKERAIIEQRFGIKPKRGVQLKGAGESKFCCSRCGTAFDYADDYLNHRQVCVPRKSTTKAKP